MLIYGGKNDQAFDICPSNKDINDPLRPQIALDDIMLFELATFTWIGVCQTGVRPEGRWNTAMTYVEESE